MQVIALPEPAFEPLSLGFSPDGRFVAAWGWGRAFVIDTVTATVRGVYGTKVIGLAELPGVGFTADSRAVVVHSDHRDHAPQPVGVYDLDSGAQLRRCPSGHGDTLEIGPDGQLVYLIHWTPQHRRVGIVRWNPLTGESLPAFGTHKGYLRQLAVSANEQWVAGGSGDEIRVWHLGGKKLPTRAARQFDRKTGHTIYGLAISSDGSFVAANPPGVRIGDVRTGEMWKLADYGTRHSREVAFHPARPVLAYSGASAEVAFYDAATRTELKRFAWDIGAITATAFSPDGLRCAAASVGKIVVWDVDV